MIAEVSPLLGKFKRYFGCMRKISDVFEATATGIEQGKQLISTTSRILFVLRTLQAFTPYADCNKADEHPSISSCVEHSESHNSYSCSS
jgi:hypothetical protein